MSKEVKKKEGISYGKLPKDAPKIKSDPNNFKALKDFGCQFGKVKISIKKGDDVKKMKLSEGLIKNLRTENVI